MLGGVGGDGGDVGEGEVVVVIANPVPVIEPEFDVVVVEEGVSVG